MAKNKKEKLTKKELSQTEAIGMVENKSKKETKSEKKVRKQQEKKAKNPGVFKSISNYFKDLKSELKKVVWPTRHRVLRGTIIVITMVVLVAIFVMALDFVFSFLMALLLESA